MTRRPYAIAGRSVTSEEQGHDLDGHVVVGRKVGTRREREGVSDETAWDVQDWSCVCMSCRHFSAIDRTERTIVQRRIVTRRPLHSSMTPVSRGSIRLTLMLLLMMLTMWWVKAWTTVHNNQRTLLWMHGKIGKRHGTCIIPKLKIAVRFFAQFKSAVVVNKVKTVCTF